MKKAQQEEVEEKEADKRRKKMEDAISFFSVKEAGDIKKDRKLVQKRGPYYQPETIVLEDTKRKTLYKSTKKEEQQSRIALERLKKV